MRGPSRLVVAVAGAAMLVAASCGSSSKSSSSSTTARAAGGSTTAAGTTATTASGGAAASLSGQKLEVVGEWSGNEQKSFQQVLDQFTKETGASVTYTSAGDEIPTVLGTRVAGGSPPDVALVPQPGLLAQFAQKGNIKPASTDVQQAVDANFSPIWKKLGSYNGVLYGVWFKAANKSTVWYNTKVFDSAGVKPPATWDDFMSAAKTITDSGTPGVSIGGADGWTLTDWFENIYIRSAGVDNYDKLTTHSIPWTDPSVTKALQFMQQLFTAPNVVAGGTSGALQIDFPTSVTQTFANPPKAGAVYEGDFVQSVISGQTSAKVGTDAKFFNFPSVNGSPTSVVGGGDVAIAFKDSPAAMALMKYLASPEAATIWVKLGGFTSANKKVDQSNYPDDTSRAIAKALIDAGDNFRFDMSDQAPTAFGGTKGAGEWKDLQDFLGNPSNIDGTQKQLEADAAAAYGK